LPITAQEWSHEIEKYCGRALSKNLVKHLCQDTEVVAYDLVPRYHSVDSFKRLSKKHLSELLGLTLDPEQLFHQNPLLFRRFCPLTFEKFFKKWYLPNKSILFYLRYIYLLSLLVVSNVWDDLNSYFLLLLVLLGTIFTKTYNNEFPWVKVRYMLPYIESFAIFVIFF